MPDRRGTNGRQADLSFWVAIWPAAASNTFLRFEARGRSMTDSGDLLGTKM